MAIKIMEEIGERKKIDPWTTEQGNYGGDRKRDP